MKMNGFGILVVCSVCSFAQNTDWQKWVERDHSYKSEREIVSATGKIKSSELQEQGDTLDYLRLNELMQQKAALEQVVREAKLASDLAKAESEASKHKLKIAENNKLLDEAISACKSGSTSECNQVGQIYSEIFQERIEIARTEVTKAEAKVEADTFSYNGFRALADSKAVDPKVLPPMEARLNARRAELKTTQNLLKLAEDSAKLLN